MENDDESRKDARISQRDQKVLATLYDSRRLDWNDPIEVKRSVSGELSNNNLVILIRDHAI